MKHTAMLVEPLFWTVIIWYGKEHARLLGAIDDCPCDTVAGYQRFLAYHDDIKELYTCDKPKAIYDTRPCKNPRA